MEPENEKKLIEEVKKVNGWLRAIDMSLGVIGVALLVIMVLTILRGCADAGAFS